MFKYVHTIVCLNLKSFSFLTRVLDRPGKTQQTRIFCGKTLLLTSLGAREPESQRARERKRTRTRKQEKEQEQEREKEQEQESKKENKNKKARERKSKNKREKKQEQEREKEWQNPVPFKENYPPPRTCHSLIGCSPSAQLSS